MYNGYDQGSVFYGHSVVMMVVAYYRNNTYCGKVWFRNCLTLGKLSHNLDPTIIALWAMVDI